MGNKKVLWEMWTKTQPSLWEKRRLHKYACPIPNDCPHALAQLIKQCTSYSPQKRPSFDKIRIYLRKMGAQESIFTRDLIKCDVCKKLFDPQNNRQKQCYHSGFWHSSFSDCGVFCATNLGPKNLGKAHWSCCYSVDYDKKRCRKSSYHVSSLPHSTP